MDKDTIRELNKENRGIDKETDVLSFPMAETGNGELMEEPDPEFDEEGNKIFNLGDIIICPDVAIEHAEEYGHSNEREFAFLTADSHLIMRN